MNHIGKIALSSKRFLAFVALFLCVGLTGYFIFWLVEYWGHLAAMERTNAFFFTADYLQGLRERQAPVSIGLGGFFTQFFQWRWMGAFLMTLSLALTSLFWWMCAKREELSWGVLPVLFFPVVLLGILQTMVAFEMSIAIAYLFFLGFVALYERFFRSRPVWFLLLLPFIWLCIGNVATLLVLLTCFICGFENSVTRKEKLFFGSILLCVLSYSLVNDSDNFLFSAFFPTNFDSGLRLLLCVLYVAPLLFYGLLRFPFLKRYGFEKPFLLFFLGSLFCGGSCWFFIRNYALLNRFTEIEYRADEAVIAGDWSALLQIVAQEKSPSVQLLFYAALAQNKLGILPEKLFSLSLPNDLFLAPGKGRDYRTEMAAGEFYYWVGVSNESVRAYTEASVSGFDYRALKRLSQLHLQRREFALAERYAGLLDKTLFYRPFSKALREKIKEQRSISSEKRAVNTESLLFVGDPSFVRELEKLHILYPSNRSISDFLLCTLLLQKEFQSFMRVLNSLSPDYFKEGVPRYYQEAALVSLQLGIPVSSELLGGISAQTRSDFISFFSILNRAGGADRAKAELSAFGTTWWYFNLYRHPQRLSLEGYMQTEKQTS